MVSWAVPTIFCLPLASVILFSVHLCPWRGPTPTPSASLPHPPPSLPIGWASPKKQSWGPGARGGTGPSAVFSRGEWHQQSEHLLVLQTDSLIWPSWI